MSSPRRRIIRPQTVEPNSQKQARIQKLRVRLESERAALLRWQARLKRAFNAVEKRQKSIARIERQLTQLEAT